MSVHREPVLILKKISVIFFITCSTAFAASPSECTGSGQSMYWIADDNFDNLTHQGFQKNVFQALVGPFINMGYCLGQYDKNNADSSNNKGSPYRILMLTANKNEKIDSATGLISINVVLFIGDSVTGSGMENSRERPLSTFPYFPGEVEAMETLAIQKILENLKDRFICHLIVQSLPPRMNIQSDRGMNGVTPVEWVLPVGQIVLSVREKGYLPFKETIKLNAPGEHEYYIKMKKRRFYHSKYIIPALVMALGGGVAYALEQEYYSRYQDLGEADLTSSPDEFENRFNQARLWERTKAAALVAAAALFTVTFWY